VRQPKLQEAVTVHHHERLAREHWLGALDAAARVQDRVLPGGADAEAEARAVAQGRLDAQAEPVESGDGLLDAPRAEELEDVVEEGTAGDGDERLRRRVRQRREAGAAPDGQHHRAADHAASGDSSGTCAARSGSAAVTSGDAASVRRATAYTAGRYAR